MSKQTMLPPLRTEAELMAQMTAPTPAVCEAVQALDGDIMVLGVAGKMGPTLAELLVRAGAKRVIGVSRFSSPALRHYLDGVGVETVACDLLDDESVAKLPDAPYLYLLAGFKFGSSGAPSLNWAMNTLVPAKLMERFPDSRMVYVSSGNVYRFMPVDGSGADEDAPLGPVGEYAESRLGGERLVEYYAERQGTPTLIARLFYATELRYGIILDIATKVKDRTPIDLSMGYANQIWQGDACDMLARSFPLCASPADVINLTGTDTLSVREVAEALGERLGMSRRYSYRRAGGHRVARRCDALRRDVRRAPRAVGTNHRVGSLVGQARRLYAGQTDKVREQNRQLLKTALCLRDSRPSSRR